MEQTPCGGVSQHTFDERRNPACAQLCDKECACFLMLQIGLENWFSALFQHPQGWLRQLLGSCWGAGRWVLTSILYLASFQPQTATSPRGRDMVWARGSAQEQPLAHRPQILLQHLGSLSPTGFCPSHPGLSHRAGATTPAVPSLRCVPAAK